MTANAAQYHAPAHCLACIFELVAALYADGAVDQLEIQQVDVLSLSE
jgi:hypothetical protein